MTCRRASTDPNIGFVARKRRSRHRVEWHDRASAHDPATQGKSGATRHRAAISTRSGLLRSKPSSTPRPHCSRDCSNAWLPCGADVSDLAVLLPRTPLRQPRRAISGCPQRRRADMPVLVWSFSRKDRNRVQHGLNGNFFNQAFYPLQNLKELATVQSGDADNNLGDRARGGDTVLRPPW